MTKKWDCIIAKRLQPDI